jgi:predicted ribosomally synthesized peptide with nif11-like leader
MLKASGRAAAEEAGGTMSQDQLDALITRLASDPTFAASLAAATTVEDAQQIAAKHGFDVTSAELTAAKSDGNLTDADLEAVSGGILSIAFCPAPK